MIEHLADSDFKGLFRNVYTENDDGSEGNFEEEVKKINEEEVESGDGEDWDEIIKAIVERQIEGEAPEPEPAGEREETVTREE